MSRFPSRRTLGGVLCAVLGASVIAGCGSSGAGSQPSSSTTGADLAYVQAQIDAATAVPKFVAPGPAFNASAARGKKIFLIPQTSAVPFLKAIDDSIIKIGATYGVGVTEYPNQGQPNQWVQAMNQAIAQKVDAIILGAPPEGLQPQLAAAKAAGIPVTILHLYDRAMTQPAGISATVLAPFATSAKLEADWAILDTRGKANVIIVTSNEVPPSKPIVDAMQAELTAHCSACKTTVIDVAAADWGTKMQTAVQSALISNPGANYVIPLYDSAAQFVLPGIVGAGRSSSVKVTSYNGTPFVLKDIVDKNIVSMDVGESQDWIGYANMDQVLRLLTGHPALPGVETPIRVFTTANVGEAGTPPDTNRAFGSDYVTGYTKLWTGQ